MVVSEVNRLNSEEVHQHTGNVVEKHLESVITQHFNNKLSGQQKRFEDVSFGLGNFCFSPLSDILFTKQLCQRCVVKQLHLTK